MISPRIKHRTEELLLACLKGDAVAREKEILRLIKKGINFEYLVDISRKKGVSSLVCNSLKFYTPPRALRISYLSASAANSHYKEELINILAAFKKNNIDVIPLKGLALSRRLYGDIASRDQSVDTDLLIREADRKSARRVLEEAGYFFTFVDEKEEYKWHDTFHKRGQRMLELHWDITMMVRSRERIAGLWRGTEWQTWDGAEYLDFKPEELLLYLSAHLVNSDAFRNLKYICDINRGIEKYGNEIDWDSITQKAKNWKMRGSLYAALALNSDCFGYRIPEGLAHRLKLSFAKRSFIRIFARKSVILKFNSLRRRFLDRFLSYILLECMEASSFKEYFAILRRLSRAHPLPK